MSQSSSSSPSLPAPVIVPSSDFPTTASTSCSDFPFSSPIASCSSSPFVPVVVDVDPQMKDMIEDQQNRSVEIAALREELKEHNQQNSESHLVRDFLSSDRVVWRFLKARKFHIAKSAQMFQEAVALRKLHNLDHILEKNCPKGLEYKVVSRHGWHGYDRFGRPIFIKNSGWQNFPALYSTGSLADRVHYNAYVNEYLRQVIIPQANARIQGQVQGNIQGAGEGEEQTPTQEEGVKTLPTHPQPQPLPPLMIDQAVTIVNLQNFGWHAIKQHNYAFVKEIAFQNGLLYPETAGHTWIINAPRIFSMVWGIVKNYLDERTRAKVQILSGNGRAEIVAVIGEEAYKALPRMIGGECTCMDDASVPLHGLNCMLGHPMSVEFIQHLKQKNKEAGITNSYHAIVDKAQLQDQEVAHLEGELAEANIGMKEGGEGGAIGKGEEEKEEAKEQVIEQ